jgi:hypothetical protein
MGMPYLGFPLKNSKDNGDGNDSYGDSALCPLLPRFPPRSSSIGSHGAAPHMEASSMNSEEEKPLIG